MNEPPATEKLKPLIPDLTGEEALLLAKLFQRLSDAIWSVYHHDMVLMLAENADFVELEGPSDLSVASDDDLPF